MGEVTVQDYMMKKDPDKYKDSFGKQEKNIGVKKANEESGVRIKELKENIKELEKENKILENKVMDLSDTGLKRKIAKQKKELGDEIKELIEENKGWELKVEDLKKEIIDLNKENEELQKVIDKEVKDK